MHVRVKGVGRHYEVEQMRVAEPRMTDGKWELLANVVEIGQEPPYQEELLILMASSSEEKIRALYAVINQRGGISSDREFKEILQEVEKTKSE
jgi:hypothetical protein